MLDIVGVISIALFYLLPLVMVALVILALVSGVAFGGARRNTLALLASGVYSLLTGGFYLYGMAASSYAKQDNAYLGNAYVGLFLLLAGVWLLSVGLADAGLAKWLVASLALAGIAGIVPIYGALSVNSTAGGAGVAPYALGALLALTAGAAGAGARRAVGAGVGPGASGRGRSGGILRADRPHQRRQPHGVPPARGRPFARPQTTRAGRLQPAGLRPRWRRGLPPRTARRRPGNAIHPRAIRPHPGAGARELIPPLPPSVSHRSCGQASGERRSRPTIPPLPSPPRRFPPSAPRFGAARA